MTDTPASGGAGGQEEATLSYAHTSEVRLEVGAMQAGKFLLTGLRAELPPLCLQCGCRVGNDGVRAESAPQSGVVITYFVCGPHARRDRILRRWVTWSLILLIAGFLMVMMAAMSKYDGAIGGAMLFLFATLVVLIVTYSLRRGGPLLQQRVGGTFYFSGVHSEVLRALPEYNHGPAAMMDATVNEIGGAPESNATMSADPKVLQYAYTMKPRGAAGAMRMGKTLVTGRSAELPENCVRCGRALEAGTSVRVELKPAMGVKLTYYLCLRHAKTDSRLFWAMIGSAGLLVLEFFVFAVVRMQMEIDLPAVNIGAVVIFAVTAAAMGIFFSLIHGGPQLQNKVGETYYFNKVHGGVLNMLPHAGGFAPPGNQI